MKLRYLISTILASSMLFAGCVKEESTDSFSNLKVSENYIIIPEAGGTVTLSVTSDAEWKFVIDENWPEKLAFNKKDGSTIKAKHDRFGNIINDPADYYVENKDNVKEGKEEEAAEKYATANWLKASVMSGAAGKTDVVFTVAASEAGREMEIALYSGNNKQFVRVRQGSLAPVEKTCKEIVEGAVVGSSYITSGNVSRLGDYAKYGAFWIIDATGEEVQVYGSTKESREAYPNVEVGDFVKFSGTWSSYKNFENAEISKHEKSLVKVVSAEQTVAVEGGELVVKVAYKGSGLFPTINDDCKDWVSFASMEYKGGIPSKIEPAPADTAVVKYTVTENTSGPRTGTITFASYDIDDDNKEVTSSVNYTFKQAANSLLSESFTEGKGEFVFENKTLPEGGTYVWTHDSRNVCMKASSYIGGSNKASESLLVSPLIDLSLAEEKVTLSFQHALNYLNDNPVKDHVSLLIKKEKDADWTTIAWPETIGEKFGKSWEFYPSSFDITAYKGSKIKIAFRYVGTTTCAPTYEVKDFMVK